MTREVWEYKRPGRKSSGRMRGPLQSGVLTSSLFSPDCLDLDVTWFLLKLVVATHDH